MRDLGKESLDFSMATEEFEPIEGQGSYYCYYSRPTFVKFILLSICISFRMVGVTLLFFFKFTCIVERITDVQFFPPLAPSTPHPAFPLHLLHLLPLPGCPSWGTNSFLSVSQLLSPSSCPPPFLLSSSFLLWISFLCLLAFSS